MKYVFRNKHCEAQWLGYLIGKKVFPRAVISGELSFRALKELLFDRYSYREASDIISSWVRHNTFRNVLWSELRERGLMGPFGNDDRFPFHNGNYLAWVEREFNQLSEREQDMVSFVDMIFREARNYHPTR